MRTFKKHLVEMSQSWSVKDLIFGEVARTYVHIPLSLPMWKRITEVKNMYGVHATSIDGMEKLVKLQGSSAQISTVDWASKYGIESLVSGIATEGGAIALVKGLAVFEADEDVYSYQDNQGRRWVEIMNFKDAFPTIGNEIDKIKLKIINRLEPELSKLWEKEYGKPLIQGSFPDLARFGTTANKAIRMFFDEIERFLKKTSTQGKMKNAFKMKSAEDSSVTDWNENIITTFKIETIIFNKKRLTVRFKDVDQGGEYDASDVLARLFPDQPVATDREPLSPFLDKLRKKVGSIVLAPQDDYEKRVKELVDTANMMNKRLK
tara:strand:- start:1330 stop:2289 length:960 start_codon:yes stop_codon:yes gene_type:complete